MVGHFGAGNAGDEAILQATLDDLRARIPDLRPTVVSANPGLTARMHQVESIANNDRSGVLDAVRECDLIMLGGGGLLQDYWDISLEGVFSRPSAPLSYYFYAALSAVFEKPLVLFAAGIGPLTTATGRLYTQMACELARLVMVRDEPSKAALVELGVREPRIHVTADPAWLLKSPRQPLGDSAPILGVALRNWTVGVEPEIWESEVALALDEFLIRHGGEVLFLPFQRSDLDLDNDTALALRIQSRMRLAQQTRLVDAGGDWRKLADAVGGCSLVLGMRYHSVLFALRQGVPVVGLVYDQKVRGLLASAGREAYAVELSGIKADNLATRLDHAFNDPKFQELALSESDRMSAAAAQNGERVAELISEGFLPEPDQAAKRWWIDELSAAAAIAEPGTSPWIEEIKSAIAERRIQARHESHRPPPYDVVCFPGIEWELRRMRPQQLLSRFADLGHRIFFIDATKFTPAAGARVALRALRKNVWEVRLAMPAPLDVYSGVMREELEVAIVDDLLSLAEQMGIDRAVSILHLSTWATVAYRVRSRLGWPVIYDCMDDWSGFGRMSQTLLDKEPSLVRSSDTVIVTAQKLWDMWSPLNPNTLLIPNAADCEHFQREAVEQAAVDLPSSKPVIGFFGVLDTWLDAELLRQAALERPQYFFAIVGAAYDVPIERLQKLPNVRLFGHQPYELLPSYLRRFDVCIIPFKIDAITLSTDPVKFYEYLAQGKPVVSTRLPQLEPYAAVTYLADNAADFVRLLDVAIDENDPSLIERRRALAQENSWTARCELFDSAIQQSFSSSQSRPRVLFVYQFLGVGGVEVVLRSRIEELQRRGCSVRIVFLDELGGRPLFENSGIDFRICRTEPDLRSEITAFQPGWIVSIDTPAILPIAREACSQAGLVYEVHSSNAEMLAPLTDSGLFTGIRGVVVPSASQRQRVQSLMAANVPIAIVPNPLSRAFMEDAVASDVPVRPVVLWVGRLDSVKNWRAFLGIAYRLRNRINATFHLTTSALSEEARATLLEAIRALGLEERLRWTEGVEHSKMPDLYRSAARSGGCLVSTSVSESFGMAALEAMACACPVIAPDILGLRDLVRHAETGRLYPAGDLAAACQQIEEAIGETPERRRPVTDKAREFALRFSPENAGDRFLAVLSDWSAPPRSAQSSTRTAESQSAHAASRERLANIIEEFSDNLQVVVIPPSLAWDAHPESNRPRQWARALAHIGCLVFYCDPRYSAAEADGFVETEARLFVSNTPIAVFGSVEAPAVMACPWNVDQLCNFRNPLLVYECAEGAGHQGSFEIDSRMEWLARAAVVIASSGALRRSIACLRPDAIVIQDGQIIQEEHAAHILNKLKRDHLKESDPVRLHALLAWREREADRLQERIESRERPIVELLQNANAEQKRVVSERDAGIAFLRGELSAKDRIIGARDQAVDFLQKTISERETAIATKDQTIDRLQQSISDRDNAIAACDRDIAFLREASASNGRVIAQRDQAIDFLKQEVAARDAIISSRDEGIEYLRENAAKYEATIQRLESQLPWWRRWLLARSRRPRNAS